MKNIVFIHGAYHGGWCWDSVVKSLSEQKGITCHLLTLPNNKEQDITSHANYVIEYIKTKNLTSVIMVGHSLAGITLEKIVEQYDDIVKIIMVTCVLVDNENFLNLLPKEVQEKYTQTSEVDGLIHPNIDALKQSMFNETSAEVIDLFANQLRPQPFNTYTEVVSIKKLDESNIPISYIRCTKDISLPPKTFEKIMNLLPKNTKLIDLDADHEAMASNPSGLAKAIFSEL